MQRDVFTANDARLGGTGMLCTAKHGFDSAYQYLHRNGLNHIIVC